MNKELRMGSREINEKSPMVLSGLTALIWVLTNILASLLNHFTRTCINNTHVVLLFQLHVRVK